MNYKVYLETLRTLDTIEQKQQFTYLVSISLHNSLEIVEKDYFLELKDNLPENIYIEGGAGTLTLWNYPRSDQKTLQALQIENEYFK